MKDTLQLKCERWKFAEFIKGCATYLYHQQQTAFKSVGHLVVQSDEFLKVMVLQTLEEELIDRIKEKLDVGPVKNIKIKFSPAEAMAMYRMLLKLPVERDKVLLFGIIADWINELDQQLIKMGIYNLAASTQKNEETEWDYLDDL